MTITLKEKTIGDYDICAELTYRWDRPCYSVQVYDTSFDLARTVSSRAYSADTWKKGFAYYVRKYTRNA